MTSSSNIEYSKIGITLPSDLLERIDKLRHDVPRSVFIRRALEQYIRRSKR